METESALVAVPDRPATIVRAAAGDVAEAFEEYRTIQATLDRAMPDCIMEIQGRSFRKKSYWRAIATAFNLDVTLEAEERQDAEGDWGYVATYKATAPNGRSATGDGACFASEKRGPQATVHNVRSHAHTRAFNRAVSNLVGFGEVSAEEMEREETKPMRDVTPPKRPPVPPAAAAPSGDAPACPKCGHEMMRSKFSDEWYCNAKRGGCGAKVPMNAEPDEVSAVESQTGEEAPF